MKRIIPVILSVLLAGIFLLPANNGHAEESVRASSGKAAMSPAQVVDQLLTKVEKNMIALAEAMPADKYNFAPSNGNFQGVRTFAEQLQHVIEANYHMFGDGASMQPANLPNVASLTSKPQLVQALKASFVFGHRAIGTLNKDNALETVKPMEGIRTRAGIMLFAIIHMNDHYGQMVEYLRMNGIVPPSSRPHKK